MQTTSETPNLVQVCHSKRVHRGSESAFAVMLFLGKFIYCILFLGKYIRQYPVSGEMHLLHSISGKCLHKYHAATRGF